MADSRTQAIQEVHAKCLEHIQVFATRNYALGLTSSYLKFKSDWDGLNGCYQIISKAVDSRKISLKEGQQIQRGLSKITLSQYFTYHNKAEKLLKEGGSGDDESGDSTEEDPSLEEKDETDDEGKNNGVPKRDDPGSKMPNGSGYPVPTRDGNDGKQPNGDPPGASTEDGSKKIPPSNPAQFVSEYLGSYRTFSGHDMVCTFELPLPSGGHISRVIGSVQTVTYSIHQDKFPVRVLGNMNPTDFTFGPRMIAGSIVFTVFDRHWAKEMMNEYVEKERVNAHFLLDELPAMNCTISFANEYGTAACLAIYGITFVNEGQVMSINDAYIENTYEYFATDIDYLTDIRAPSIQKKKSETDHLPEATDEEKETLKKAGHKDEDKDEEDNEEKDIAEELKKSFIVRVSGEDQTVVSATAWSLLRNSYSNIGDIAPEIKLNGQFENETEALKFMEKTRVLEELTKAYKNELEKINKLFNEKKITSDKRNQCIRIIIEAAENQKAEMTEYLMSRRW